jgi:hypothetical protein
MEMRKVIRPVVVCAVLLLPGARRAVRVNHATLRIASHGFASSRRK